MYIIEIMYTFLFWEHIYVIKLSGPNNFMAGYVSSSSYLYLGVILTIQLWLAQYSSGQYDHYSQFVHTENTKNNLAGNGLKSTKTTDISLASMCLLK